MYIFYWYTYGRKKSCKSRFTGYLRRNQERDVGFNTERDENKLVPIHTWLVPRNEIIRGRKFCEFELFGITDKISHLKALDDK